MNGMADALTLLRPGLALAAVILLALGLAWAVRRFGGATLHGLRQPGRLGIVASQALDARTRLVLVRCCDREHLLAVGPAGVTLIESLSALAGGDATSEGA